MRTRTVHLTPQTSNPRCSSHRHVVAASTRLALVADLVGAIAPRRWRPQLRPLLRIWRHQRVAARATTHPSSARHRHPAQCHQLGVPGAHVCVAGAALRAGGIYRLGPLKYWKSSLLSHGRSEVRPSHTHSARASRKPASQLCACATADYIVAFLLNATAYVWPGALFRSRWRTRIGHTETRRAYAPLQRQDHTEWLWPCLCAATIERHALPG